MSKILETIIEPSQIEVSSSFLLKIKVEKIASYNLITEEQENIVLETEENIITEGDYYE